MEADTQRVSAASAGLTSLALRLAKQLAANNKSSDRGNGGNLVFSPLSIYAALALVAAGAPGAALDELLALLGARRWLRMVLKPVFRATAVECFKAEVRAVDFQTKAEEARQEINSWVSEATKGLITDVLSPGSVDAETGLMLVNAIYFKGKWVRPFDERCTEVEDFYLLDGTAVQTPLMRGRGSYLVAVHGGFKVLKLPYQAPLAFPRFGGGMRMAKVARRGGVGAMYSLCVFLPDARDGLWSLVDELAASGPAFLHDHLPWSKVCVHKLRLPRFKMSFHSDLTDALREMGLEATLDPRDGDTDLTDMAERKGYAGESPKIDKVCHKAVIELNEEGTEAVAVTYVGVFAPSCAPPGYRPETVDFVADHPFAFFVMEEVSGAVVFAGCVLDPSQ
ncbi:hypothetical protein SORBI_3001G066800 [Sorghum bicolor]|uniref:Serpin domain-containing protein n=1 Tax=Sorghum bicolor TaxID=4558 RepID=A0A1Z5S4M0_SORBI|nr:hypothetical protein SORBI_3001G066800 [Sorghum bicolor]